MSALEVINIHEFRGVQLQMLSLPPTLHFLVIVYDISVEHCHGDLIHVPSTEHGLQQGSLYETNPKNALLRGDPSK